MELLATQRLITLTQKIGDGMGSIEAHLAEAIVGLHVRKKWGEGPVVELFDTSQKPNVMGLYHEKIGDRFNGVVVVVRHGRVADHDKLVHHGCFDPHVHHKIHHIDYCCDKRI